MGMPQDAINAFLVYNPTHFWVMNETSGTTFADLGTGAVPLTAGSTTDLNWGATLTSGGQGLGGPGTPVPHFDGTVNAGCTAPGKTLGGLTQWSFFAYTFPETSTTSGCLYSEGSASSTDHFVIRWNAATTFLNYHDAGRSVVIQSSSSTGSGLGSGLFGATSDGTGTIRWYKGGVPAYVSNSVGFPTVTSAWGETVTTNVGFDPQSLAVPFQGLIGWVVCIPSFLTDQQIFALSQAISPNPPNCYVWSKATSGVVFPNSELWNSKLPDNTTIDPDSFAKITQWGSLAGTTLALGLGGGGSSLYDAQRAGPFTASPYLDNFERLAENPLTNNGAWVAGAPFGLGRLRTNGTQALITGSDLTYAGASWGTTVGPPLSIYAYFPTVAPTGANYFTSLVWLTNPTTTPTSGYFVTVGGSPLQWFIGRYDNAVTTGAGTNLTSGSFSWANGDALGLTIQANGTIQFFHNSAGAWSLVGSVNDTTYTAPGSMGVILGSAVQRMNRLGGGPGFAGWVPIKDEFFNVDQRRFLNACNANPTAIPEAPQPTGGGNDSLAAGVELDRGRQWDEFEGSGFAPLSVVNRRPLWPPQITATSITTTSGTLAAGFYDYTWATISASGREGSNYGGGIINNINLTAIGTINFTLEVDKLNWSDAPVSFRLYRRGPYVASGAGTTADFGLLTTVPASTFVDYTVGANFFHDDGSFGAPDTTQQPYLLVTASQTLTVSGTNNAGQNVLTLRSNPNAPSHPTYGIPNYFSQPIGPVVLGSGGTLENVYIAKVLSDTQVRLSRNLAFTHSDGETLGPVGVSLGAAGTALVPEVTTLGGGGSWDWYHNAAFNPNWSPSATNNNGESATSCPGMAGVITTEEALNGLIPHVIGYAHYVSNQSVNSHRWPAPRNDGGTISTAVNLFREGIRFRLPVGLDENLVNYNQRSAYVTAFQKAFVVALRDYGAIDHDSSPGGLFYVENNAAETGRSDFGWIYGGLAPASTGVTAILDFMFKPAAPITGNTTQGSQTVTNISSFTGATVNQWINNPAVMPYLTQIQSTASVSSTLTLTKPATATVAGASLYLGVMYQLQVISSFRYPAKTDAFASFTATTTNNSAVLTGVSSFTNVVAGLVLTGVGVQHNATILSFDGVSTITMNLPATANGAAVAITGGRRTNHTDVGTPNTIGFQQLVPY